MENLAIRHYKWLERHVRNLKNQDPKFQSLKDCINELREKIKLAPNDQISQLLRKQDSAIQSLIGYIASKGRA